MDGWVESYYGSQPSFEIGFARPLLSAVNPPKSDYRKATLTRL